MLLGGGRGADRRMELKSQPGQMCDLVSCLNYLCLSFPIGKMKARIPAHRVIVK